MPDGARGGDVKQTARARKQGRHRTVWCAVAAALGGSVSLAAAQDQGFPPIEDVLGGAQHRNVVEVPTPAFGIGDYEDLLSLIPPARNRGSAWEIWDTAWSAEDERGYEAFVKAIGRSGCLSIDDCLRSPANPWRDLEEEELWLGDCTDMVYVLRGYYAWKRGLPFGFQDAVAIRGNPRPGDDARYSEGGNRVLSRAAITHPEGRAPKDGPKLLRGLFNIVSTAMLRVDARDEKSPYTDFYPVTITREAVRPGSVAYDVYGHVSIVYDVDVDGRVYLISSHPDYTVTRELFGRHVAQTQPELGGGLKAWRPVRLVGATRTARGTYVGGQVVAVANSQLADFSLEQHVGTEPDASGAWDRGRFVFNGRALPYHEFVRARLRAPGQKIDPLAEMASATSAMCSALISRKTAVNLAVYAGLPARAAPERLPPNIYGTYGDWERYATPSRDARLKTQAVELRQLAEDLVREEAAGNPEISFVGDLPAALFDIYDRGAKACQLNYRRSDGSVVKLTMDHAVKRLFDLSFDPFHCPERRWGAEGSELATCTDDPAKAQWYEAQRYLRNQVDRTYDLRTDFKATDLKDPGTASPADGGLGLSTAPDINVKAFLLEHADGHALAGPDLPVTILKGIGAPRTPTGRR